MSVMTRIGSYVLAFMIGVFCALVAANYRDAKAELIVLQEEEGGVTIFGHRDSQVLTEVVQDEDADGVEEFHAYRVRFEDGSEALLALLNDADDSELEGSKLLMQYKDVHDGPKSVAVGLQSKNSNGQYQRCSVVFSENGADSQIAYHDWNLDGRLDIEEFADGNRVNARYKDTWLKVVKGWPLELNGHVTALVDGKETRLDFVDGEFVAAQEAK